MVRTETNEGGNDEDDDEGVIEELTTHSAEDTSGGPRAVIILLSWSSYFVYFLVNLSSTPTTSVLRKSDADNAQILNSLRHQSLVKLL